MTEYHIVDIYIDPFKEYPLKAQIEYIPQNKLDVRVFTIDFKYNIYSYNIELHLQSLKELISFENKRRIYLELKENPSIIKGRISSYFQSKDKNFLMNLMNLRVERDERVTYTQDFDGHKHMESDYQFVILRHINKIL